MSFFPFGAPDWSEVKKNNLQQNWSMHVRSWLIRGQVKQEKFIEVRVYLVGDKDAALLNQGVNFGEVNLSGEHCTCKEE